MSDAITTFFDAWSMTDADARMANVTAATSADFTYADPRSGARLKGYDAVSEYVGMFSANAPGWTAKVVSSSEVQGYMRAVVAFGGKGPDGSDMTQLGTYFCEADESGKLVMMAGFVGTGAPE